MSKEAIKLALGVLKSKDQYGSSIRTAKEQAIKALEAELAKQDKPVIDKSAAIRIATALGWTPPSKPLTDEEINDRAKAEGAYGAHGVDFWFGARFAEIHHNIKE